MLNLNSSTILTSNNEILDTHKKKAQIVFNAIKSKIEKYSDDKKVAYYKSLSSKIDTLIKKISNESTKNILIYLNTLISNEIENINDNNLLESLLN